MSKDNIAEKSDPTGRLLDLLGGLAVALTFILPLKFGMMAGLPETATAMPTSAMELFYFSWPYFVFSSFYALLLIGVAIHAIVTKQGFRLDYGMIIVGSWVLLLLSSLIGFSRASTFDFPLIQLTLFLGVASLAVAVHQILAIRPNLRIWFINAIVASTVLIVLFGLNQYFSGFKETLNYVHAKEMESGVKVSADMLSRLRETRVFATFSICNSLGAHLVLTIPLCVWAMLSKSSTLKTVITTLGVFLLYISPSLNLSRAGFFIVAFPTLVIVALTLSKFPGKNRRLISLIVLVPVLGVMLFVFRHTNSRGAFLAAGFAILILAALSPVKLKTKSIGVVAALLFVVPFLFTDILDRSLRSMYFRFDYYLAAIKMFVSQPFTGVGWGDFFHEYMRMKEVPGSEAPHTPHNFVLSFASQCGIAGFAASLWVMAAPVVLWWRRRKIVGIDWFNVVVLAGWFAWCVHSLIDFNIQVPGTIGVAVVLLLLLKTDRESRDSENGQASEREDGAADAIEEEENPNQGDKSESKTRRSTSKVYLVVGVLLALSTLLISFERYRVEAKLTRLMSACGMSVAGSREAKNISNAELDVFLTDCVKVAPYSPFPWICAGNYAQRMGRWGKSEYFFKEALKRAPERASVYYHLFMAETALGKFKAANHSLEKAAELFPNAYGPILEKFRNNESHF